MQRVSTERLLQLANSIFNCFKDFTGLDQSNDFVRIKVDGAIGVHERNLATNQIIGGFRSGSQLFGILKVGSLCTAHQLDCKNMLNVVDGLCSIAGSNCAEAHVILLICARGDAVHTGGMGENLVFGYERGSCILSDHVTVVDAFHRCQEALHAAQLRIYKAFDAAFRDVGIFSHGKTECRHGNGDRLTMEVTTGEDVTVIREDERVICMSAFNAYTKSWVFSLPFIMSKYLMLGLDVEAIYRCVVGNPVKYLGFDKELGSLLPGTCANIAIHRIVDHDVCFEDAYGEKRYGKQVFRTEMTICQGWPVYRSIEL